MSRKPSLITLHHFPGSGGTIVSKAIATSDDAIVLSEIHPDRFMGGRYHPMVQLARGYDELLDDADRERIDAHFLAEIELAHEVADHHGRLLVVRDHSFRDFLQQDRGSSRLVELLSARFALTKLLSLRDPIDAYLSLRARRRDQGGEIEVDPDQYCDRFLRFVDAFPDANHVRYEDFVGDPATILEALCVQLGLTFNPDFAARIGEFRHFTGDSGRQGHEISPRPRRELPPELAEAFEASESYAAICARFDYEPLTSAAAAT